MANERRDMWFKIIESALQRLDSEDKLGADAQDTVVLDQQSVGRLSRMNALQQQAMAKATQARRDVQRVRLQSAFRRLEDGEFGYCDDCGDEIAEPRLKLDPGVTRCVSCASG